MPILESETVDKFTQPLVISGLLVFILSRGKGAQGVARSGFPLACDASESLDGYLCCWRHPPFFADAFPGHDARLGGHGAVSELIRLVARLHDVTVMGDTWRDKCYSRNTAESPEAKRKAFNRAVGDLVKLGKLSVADDVFSLPCSL